MRAMGVKRRFTITAVNCLMSCLLLGGTVTFQTVHSEPGQEWMQPMLAVTAGEHSWGQIWQHIKQFLGLHTGSVKKSGRGKKPETAPGLKKKPEKKPKKNPKPDPVPLNNSPEITSLPPTQASPGIPYMYQPVAIDADGDRLVWTMPVAPADMLIDPDSGLIVAQSLSPGLHVLSLRVEDGNGGSDTQDYSISLQAGPVITSIPPELTYTGTPYRYDVDALEPAGLDLRYELLSGPAGALIDPVSGLFEWTANTPGSMQIGIRVSNTSNQSVTQNFDLTVLAPDGIKIVSSAPTEAYVSIQYEYPLALLTAPGSGVGYYFNQAPPGMTIAADTGLITWIPVSPGTFAVEVVATNDRGYLDTQRYNILVNSLEQMDQIFSSVVNTMFADLLNGDLAGAMQVLTMDAQLRLGPVFSQLLNGNNHGPVTFTEPVRVSISPDMAEYMVRRTSANGDRVYMITFLRDNDRQWRINDL